MSFLLLSVDHIIVIHDEVLEPHELQGMAGDTSLDGALSRVDNRLKYGLVEMFIRWRRPTLWLFLRLIALTMEINERHFR